MKGPATAATIRTAAAPITHQSNFRRFGLLVAITSSERPRPGAPDDRLMMAEPPDPDERGSGAECGLRLGQGGDHPPRQLRGAAADGLGRPPDEVTEVARQHHQIEPGRAADQGKRLARPVQTTGRQDLLTEREQGGAGFVVRAATPLQPDGKAQLDRQVPGPSVDPSELGQAA